MTKPRRPDPLPLGGTDGLPYSKGLMARALIASGVAAVPAYELALRAESDLRSRGRNMLDLDRLRELAGDVLGEEEAERAIRRLRRYDALRLLDVPIILLVGGATGTGKSTTATELAHRLGITRVTSTDFIRQTMRAFFSPEFMPTVHYSSFEAGEGLPDQEREAGDPLLLGFIEQTRHVLVGVQASIDRALEEGWSTVIEGVHLVPGMVVLPVDRALAVHVVVAIENEDIHSQHFVIRDADSGGGRALEKYLDHFGDIRHIQDFIVNEAQKTGVPVIQNGNIERAIAAVLELVLDRASAIGSTV